MAGWADSDDEGLAELLKRSETIRAQAQREKVSRSALLHGRQTMAATWETIQASLRSRPMTWR